MGVRVAYGDRDNISSAIASGVIPSDSLIFTKEQDDISELFFYDIDGNLKPVAERNRFLSVSEAAAWARKYDCKGHIYSVQNGAEWVLYVVQDDYKLSPVKAGDGGTLDVDDVARIDGGNAFGLN